LQTDSSAEDEAAKEQEAADGESRAWAAMEAQMKEQEIEDGRRCASWGAARCTRWGPYHRCSAYGQRRCVRWASWLQTNSSQAAIQRKAEQAEEEDMAQREAAKHRRCVSWGGRTCTRWGPYHRCSAYGQRRCVRWSAWLQTDSSAEDTAAKAQEAAEGELLAQEALEADMAHQEEEQGRHCMTWGPTKCTSMGQFDRCRAYDRTCSEWSAWLQKPSLVEVADVSQVAAEEEAAEHAMEDEMQQQEAAKGRRCVSWGAARCTRWGPYHRCSAYGQRRCLRWSSWLQTEEVLGKHAAAQEKEEIEGEQLAEEALNADMRRQESERHRRCVSWGAASCTRWGPYHRCSAYGQRRCRRWSAWLQTNSSGKEDTVERKAEQAVQEDMAQQEAAKGRKCVSWGAAECKRWGPYHKCEVYSERKCLRWSSWLQTESSAEDAAAKEQEAAEGESLAQEALEADTAQQEKEQGRYCLRWGSASCTRWGAYHKCQAYGKPKCVRWSMWLQVGTSDGEADLTGKAASEVHAEEGMWGDMERQEAEKGRKCVSWGAAKCTRWGPYHKCAAYGQRKCLRWSSWLQTEAGEQGEGASDAARELEEAEGEQLAKKAEEADMASQEKEQGRHCARWGSASCVRWGPHRRCQAYGQRRCLHWAYGNRWLQTEAAEVAKVEEERLQEAMLLQMHEQEASKGRKCVSWGAAKCARWGPFHKCEAYGERKCLRWSSWLQADGAAGDKESLLEASEGEEMSRSAMEADMAQQEEAEGRKCVSWGGASCKRWGPHHKCELYGERKCLRWSSWLQLEGFADADLEGSDSELTITEHRAQEGMYANMAHQEEAKGKKCMSWGAAECKRWGPYHKCEVYRERKCLRWSSWLQADSSTESTAQEIAEQREEAEGEAQAWSSMEEDMFRQEEARGRRCVRWGSASCTRWGPYHHCQAYGQRRCVRWGAWVQTQSAGRDNVEKEVGEGSDAQPARSAMLLQMAREEAAKGMKCVSWSTPGRKCLRWSSLLQAGSVSEAQEQAAAAEAQAREAAEGERLAKQAMEEDMKEQEAAQGRRCVSWGGRSCTRWGPYHRCQAYGQRRCIRWSAWLQRDASRAASAGEVA